MRPLRLLALALPLTAAPAAAQDCLGLNRPSHSVTAELTTQLAGGWRGQPTGLALGASKRWLWASVESGADASTDRTVFSGDRLAGTIGTEVVAFSHLGLCAGFGATNERSGGSVPLTSHAYGATLASSYRVGLGAVPLTLFGVARVEQRADEPSVAGFRSVYKETGAAYRMGASLQLFRFVGARGFVDYREGAWQPGMSLSLILAHGTRRQAPRDTIVPAPVHEPAPAPAPAPPVVRDTTPAAPAAPLDADHDGVADLDDTCPNTPAGATVDAAGCPKLAVAAPKVIRERLALRTRTPIVLEGVRFASGTATLLPSSASTLDRIVAALTVDTTVRVEIAGHTDNRGLKAKNIALSTQRAQAVAAYLSARGIAASRLVAKGYGSAKPLAPNTTPTGRARNRRVELTPLP